jgi:hypothetical protein
MAGNLTAQVRKHRRRDHRRGARRPFQEDHRGRERRNLELKNTIKPWWISCDHSHLK